MSAAFVTGTERSDAALGWNAESLDVGVSGGTDTATVYYPVFEQHHVFNQGKESGQNVLRHGWFQPGFDTWAFETLDAGVSVGRANATVYYPTYQQHHVFDQGIESGQSVLRHGWFQPGFDTWMFETLDAGIATGTDTATIVYMDQHHVFTHGYVGGQDVVRHGWFDPAVGVWQFETLDQGVSRGMLMSTMVWQDQLHFFSSMIPDSLLRHGWFDPGGGGWHFESFDIVFNGYGWRPIGGTAAIVGSDGNQNVFVPGHTAAICCGIPDRLLIHGWYDGAQWNWDNPGGLTSWHGANASASTNPNGNTEIFTFGDFAQSLGHAWWDGHSWQKLGVDTTMSSGFFNSTSSFPPFAQLHAFDQGNQFNPASKGQLRHLWWNPA